MEQMSIGSVVKLRSGGPQMTIKGYGTKIEFGSILAKHVEDKAQVRCQWFDAADNLHEDVFPVVSLEFA